MANQNLFFVPSGGGGGTGTVGPAGPQGAPGAPGVSGISITGPAGIGVPTGGAVNYQLAKAGSEDYNTKWVSGVNHVTRHQFGGEDVLNVSDLQGVLAQRQDADKLYGNSLPAASAWGAYFNDGYGNISYRADIVSGTELNAAVTVKAAQHLADYNHGLIADTTSFVSGTELNEAVTFKAAQHLVDFNHNLIADTSSFVSGTELNTAVTVKAAQHLVDFNHNLIADTSSFVSGTELNESVTLKMGTHETTYDHTKLHDAITVSGSALLLTGQLLTPNFGSAVGQLAAGNDPRFSDLRNPYPHNQNLNTITMISGAGAPTYNDLDDWLRISQSGGRITGGVITADTYTGSLRTFSVSDVEVVVHQDNSLNSPIVFSKKTAVAAQAPTNGYINWVYFDYNAGTPQLGLTTDRSTINMYNQVALGRLWVSGVDMEVQSTGVVECNVNRLHHTRYMDKYGNMDRASGGMISETGTRNFAVTAGNWWASTTNFTTASKNTSSGDTFTYWYRSGAATWKQVTGQTAIDNLQYNDTTTNALATLSTGKYGTHYVYMTPAGALHVVYGQGEYTISTSAAAGAPTNTPAFFSDYAKYIGKITIIKSSATFYATESPFTTTLTAASSTPAHNDTTAKQGGAAGEYYHLTQQQVCSGVEFFRVFPGYTNGSLSKASSTTFTDTYASVYLPAAGVYALQTHGVCFPGAGSIKLRPQYTGTWTATDDPSWQWFAGSYGTPPVFAAGSSTNQYDATATPITIAPGVAWSWWDGGGIVNATSAGTFSIQYAQNASNADPAIVRPGHFIIAWRKP